tara:strand:+ start:32 stop:379 length:348 start_codon:yes stop_codon:yes gene_type:complete
MNTKPIYASEIHKVVVEDYITLLHSFVSDLATESQYQEWSELTSTIYDYHNGYDGDVASWIMIMPLHLSVMTSGFFVGIENDENRGKVRGYKLILDRHLNAMVEPLSNLINDTNE